MWSTPLFHFANTRDFLPNPLGTSFHRNGVLFLIKYKFYLWSRFATSSWWISPISLYFAHTPLGKTTLVSLQHHSTKPACADSQFIYIYSPRVCWLPVEGSVPGHFLFFSCSLTGCRRKRERERERYTTIFHPRAAAPGATACDLLFVYLLAMERKV
jgi:hypothetical protein